MRPVTIITVQLDHDDRLKAIEKKLGIKVKPFLIRTMKYRTSRRASKRKTGGA